MYLRAVDMNYSAVNIRNCSVIAIADNSNLSAHTYSNNGYALLSQWELDAVILDVLLTLSEGADVDHCSLIAASTTQFFVAEINAVGTVVSSASIPHLKHRMSASILSYLPVCGVAFSFCEDQIISFSIRDLKDTQCSLNDCFVKLDAARKYAPIDRDALQLEKVVVPSLTEPFLLLISRASSTGLLVIQWCALDPSGLDSLYVYWETRLTCTYIACESLPHLNCVLVANAGAVDIYDCTGVVTRCEIPFVNSASESITSVAVSSRNTDFPSRLILSTTRGNSYLCMLSINDEIGEITLLLKLCGKVGTELCLFNPSGTTCSACILTNNPVFKSRLPFYQYMHVIFTAEENDNFSVLLFVGHKDFGTELVQMHQSDPDMQKEASGDTWTINQYSVFDAIVGIKRACPISRTGSVEYVAFSCEDSTKYSAEDTDVTSVLTKCCVGSVFKPTSSMAIDIACEHSADTLSTFKLFTVICDQAVDAVPLTARSHSKPWSTMVVISSRLHCETSLLTINHAGKLQLSIERSDLVVNQETIAFFRVTDSLIAQCLHDRILLLDIKTLRKIKEHPLASTGLSSFIGHCNYVQMKWMSSSTVLPVTSSFFVVTSLCDCSVLSVTTRGNMNKVLTKSMSGEITAAAVFGIFDVIVVVLAIWNSNDLHLLYIPKPTGEQSKSTNSQYVERVIALPNETGPLTCNPQSTIRHILIILHSKSHLSVVCGNDDGRICILNFEVDVTTKFLSASYSAYVSFVVGGLCSIVSHPFMGGQDTEPDIATGFVANGYNCDYLYKSKYSSTRDVLNSIHWTRTLVVRSASEHRVCLNATHSFVPQLCPYSSCGSKSAHSLQYVWLGWFSNSEGNNTMTISLGSLSHFYGTENHDTLTLCPLICRRFEFRVHTITPLYDGAFAMLLYSHHGQLEVNSKEVYGLKLIDTLTMNALWDYSGTSTLTPMAVYECPNAPIGPSYICTFIVVTACKSLQIFGINCCPKSCTTTVHSLGRVHQSSTTSEIRCAESLPPDILFACSDVDFKAYRWCVSDTAVCSHVYMEEVTVQKFKSHDISVVVDMSCCLSDDGGDVALIYISLALVGVEVWIFHKNLNLLEVHTRNIILDCIRILPPTRYSTQYDSAETGLDVLIRPVIGIDRLSGRVLCGRGEEFTIQTSDGSGTGKEVICNNAVNLWLSDVKEWCKQPTHHYASYCIVKGDGNVFTYSVNIED